MTREPATAAGQRLDAPSNHDPDCDIKPCSCGLTKAILAIEREAIANFLRDEKTVAALTRWLNGDDAGDPSKAFRAGLVSGGYPFAHAILAALAPFEGEK